ncbi:hypothetical protein GF402_04805 [Candidatus Fermentibacteria bacterium]|nr:hypothetical protein [Candidatus Fermentibacteria bacterium]
MTDRPRPAGILRSLTRRSRAQDLLGLILLFVLSLRLGQSGIPVEDGAEFLTVARLGGIAHPPGMPMLALACRASWVLLGSSCLKVLYGLMASVGLWLLARRQGIAGYLMAAAVLLLPCSRERLLLWDAYCPLFLLLAVAWECRPRSLPCGYLTGVALCIHPLGIVLPAICFSRRTCPLRFGGGLLLGLSPYLALPLLSEGGAIVNWGNPSQFSLFVRHVTAAGYREVYGRAMGAAGFNTLLLHAREVWSMLSPAVIPAAVIGAAVVLRTRRRAVSLGLLLVLELAFVIAVNPMAAGTSQTGVLALFVIVVLSVESIRLVEPYVSLALALAIAGWGIFSPDPLIDQGPVVRDVYRRAPIRTVLFTSDNDLLYGGWQLKYVQDRRPDIAPLSTANFSGWFECMAERYTRGLDLSRSVTDVGDRSMPRDSLAALLVRATAEDNTDMRIVVIQ